MGGVWPSGVTGVANICSAACCTADLVYVRCLPCCRQGTFAIIWGSQLQLTGYTKCCFRSNQPGKGTTSTSWERTISLSYEHSTEGIAYSECSQEAI